MNSYKKLASDTILMAIGNFSSKVLIFLLLPFYTYILTTEEYGVADLFITTVNLLVPILTLAITESTFRLAFDENIDQDKNITNSVFCICLSVILLLPIIFALSKWNDSFYTYGIFFALLYLFNALNTCLHNFARGTNHIKIFVTASFIYTLILVIANIVFLTVIKIGLYGYFLAMISAYVGSSAFLFLMLKCWKTVRIKKIDFTLLRLMLKFSIPMIFSTTAWWAMNSVDKYMLIEWYGIDVSGLYGVAQKLPTIISVLSSIFVQAWQISAISTYKSEHSDEFYTNVYSVYNVALFLAAGMIIFLTKPLAALMFQKEYFSAFVYSPILILSGIYSCLSYFLQSPFVAGKKSGVLLQTTLAGLAVNIVANVVFMKLMGPIGATYATMAGFITTWLMRIIKSRQFVKIEVDWPRVVVSMALLFVQALLITYDVPFAMLYAGLILVFILLLHVSTVKMFCAGAFKMLKKIKK